MQSNGLLNAVGVVVICCYDLERCGQMWLLSWLFCWLLQPEQCICKQLWLVRMFLRWFPPLALADALECNALNLLVSTGYDRLETSSCKCNYGIV